MQELRHLFSLMVGSKRKYVDPSRAVDILKDAFKSSESQQVGHSSCVVHVILQCARAARAASLVSRPPGRRVTLGVPFPLQQDVSEFSHKLLDWLEDAFQKQAEEER